MGMRLLVALAALFALSAAPARADVPPPPSPLFELKAPGDGGYLYTLSQDEADRAVARHGFSLLPAPTAYLWKSPFENSQPIFRLRIKDRASYLLTPSVEERDSLVAKGTFVYEGVAGHALNLAVAPEPGMTPLWRYSNNGVWRLTLESGRAELERQGYRVDGRLGYVYASPNDMPPPPPGTQPPPSSGQPPSTPPRSTPNRAAKLRRAIRRCQSKHRGSKRSTKRARKRCISRARKKYGR